MSISEITPASIAGRMRAAARRGPHTSSARRLATALLDVMVIAAIARAGARRPQSDPGGGAGRNPRRPCPDVDSVDRRGVARAPRALRGLPRAHAERRCRRVSAGPAREWADRRRARRLPVPGRGPALAELLSALLRARGPDAPRGAPGHAARRAPPPERRPRTTQGAARRHGTPRLRHARRSCGARRGWGCTPWVRSPSGAGTPWTSRVTRFRSSARPTTSSRRSPRPRWMSSSSLRARSPRVRRCAGPRGSSRACRSR